MTAAQAQADAASTYRQAAFENAPPLKILRLLYQGALRFLNQALEADAENEAAFYNDRVSRADAIVCELRCSLDHQAVPELCNDLERLYLFAESRLQDALIDRDKDAIQDTMRVLETLLDGWRELEVQSEAA